MDTIIIDLDSVDDLHGLNQLVKGLKRKAVKIALISELTRKEMLEILSTDNLLDFIDFTVSIDDFTMEESNVYDVALRKLEKAYEDIILFTSKRDLVESYSSSDLKTASFRRDDIDSDIVVNDIRDMKFCFDQDKNLNGVYKIRAKSKEFLKNIFFIDSSFMKENMDNFDIYSYYLDNQIQAAILVEDKNIIREKFDDENILNLLKDKYKDTDIYEIG